MRFPVFTVVHIFCLIICWPLFSPPGPAGGAGGPAGDVGRGAAPRGPAKVLGEGATSLEGQIKPLESRLNETGNA